MTADIFIAPKCLVIALKYSGRSSNDFRPSRLSISMNMAMAQLIHLKSLLNNPGGSAFTCVSIQNRIPTSSWLPQIRKTADQTLDHLHPPFTVTHSMSNQTIATA
jgi:hypothetical protein